MNAIYHAHMISYCAEKISLNLQVLRNLLYRKQQMFFLSPPVNQIHTVRRHSFIYIQSMNKLQWS